MKKEGSEGFNFPQGRVQASQSTRTAVEDLLTGQDIYTIGNAPTGHAPQGGDTVFFHRVEYLGNMSEPDLNLEGIQDYKWLTKEELVSEVETPWKNVIRDMC